MKTETDPEENAFELGGLVAKPTAASSKTAPSRRAAPRPKAELFARITRRHSALLADVDRVSTVIIFHHLMMHSVKVYHRPFELPAEYLTGETGMNRRQQLRAVHSLAKIGIIRISRERHNAPLIIAIPRTTKPGRKAT
jgi:hypothetical protein